MAKSKAELIKRGKELGLNLKSSMSIYELEHRIKEKEAEKKDDTPAKKTTTRARRGEY
jgi:7-cyano-7-deazaguanine synthase in queuosine biosynthesis